MILKDYHENLPIRIVSRKEEKPRRKHDWFSKSNPELLAMIIKRRKEVDKSGIY